MFTSHGVVARGVRFSLARQRSVVARGDTGRLRRAPTLSHHHPAPERAPEANVVRRFSARSAGMRRSVQFALASGTRARRSVGLVAPGPKEPSALGAKTDHSPRTTHGFRASPL